MRENNSIFKKPALIGYLVKTLKKRYPNKQIGKTVIQKLTYILNRKEITDFHYSLYHYGPYSFQVSEELQFAEDIGIVSVKWMRDKGYFIDATDKLKEFENLLTDAEKEIIEKIANKYGKFNAVELSIIATALYLKDELHVPDNQLIDYIRRLKPNYSKEFIKDVLQKAEILVE